MRGQKPWRNIAARWLMPATLLICGPAWARLPAHSGDLSGDGSISLLDEQLLRDHLLGKIQLTAAQRDQADLNVDGKINIADFVGLMILLKPTPTPTPTPISTPTPTPSGPTATPTPPPGGPMIVTLTLAESVTLDLVRIPAGSFQMGAPESERGWHGEAPVHTVTFAADYYMGKTEVTQRQWQAVMGSNPSQFTGDPDRPVENVTWDDITKPGGFLDLLNQRLGATGQGSLPVRLPSEAEWEYACRAGTTTRFYFGDSLAVDDECTDGPTGSPAYPGSRSDYLWFCSNSGGATQRVGLKRPNAFGLFDMSGNVWEWCQDSAVEGYEGAPDDGSAWESPYHNYRMERGGGWADPAYGCRSAHREVGRQHMDGSLGFRVARGL